MTRSPIPALTYIWEGGETRALLRKAARPSARLPSSSSCLCYVGSSCFPLLLLLLLLLPLLLLPLLPPPRGCHAGTPRDAGMWCSAVQGRSGCRLQQIDSGGKVGLLRIL